MAEITLDRLYVTLPGEQMKHYKDVVLSDKGVKMTLVKTLLPAYMANKQGLIGWVVNKFLSSKLKKEEFEASFKDVQKVELSTTHARGRTMHNLMMWNCDPKEASYENIDLTISPTAEQLPGVKKVLKTLLARVDYKELEPQTL